MAHDANLQQQNLPIATECPLTTIQRIQDLPHQSHPVSRIGHNIFSRYNTTVLDMQSNSSTSSSERLFS